jgi:hypothetical protein
MAKAFQGKATRRRSLLLILCLGLTARAEWVRLCAGSTATPAMTEREEEEGPVSTCLSLWMALLTPDWAGVQVCRLLSPMMRPIFAGR